MLRFRGARKMSGEDGGGIDVVIRQRRRFRRWRKTLLGRFQKVTVIVGIIRVSLAGQIFVVIRGAFVKEAIFDVFGGRETSFKLRVLGG